MYDKTGSEPMTSRSDGYRLRAKALLAEAAEAPSEEIRRLLLALAAQYEALAIQADAWGRPQLRG